MKTKLRSIRNLSAVFALFTMLSIPVSGLGQSVFTDDFSTNTSATYTTSGTIGASAWSVTRSGADWGGRRNTSPAQLELTNDASATANVAGWVLGSTTTSSFSSPYNTTLSSNTGLVTWTFNMRQPRTDPAGFISGSYGVAFVLGATSTSINNTGTGYAVVLGQSGATDPVRLVRFLNGLQGTMTNIITSNTSGLTDFGTEYLSIKVTYDPSNDQWEFFLRNDGASAFADPASGTLTTQGTATDNTYTSTSLTVLGGYWQGSTGANLAAFYDNVTVSVTASGTPSISAIASLTPFSAVSGTASASQSYTVSGDNLTADVTVTAPSKYEVSTDNSNFSGSVNLAQTGGNLTGEPVTVYVRIAASAAAGSANGNIVHSSTGATSVNVAVTGTVQSTEPSGHAASFSAAAVSQTQIDLSFSAASSISNCAGYLILQRSGSAPTGAPSDATGYSAGNTIGDGTVAAIVTNTSATSASITGLSAGTQYHFALFPFNWDGANASTYNYKTDGSVPAANATTNAALDATSEVDGPALGSQPDPVVVSSLADTDGEAVRVFDMDVYDYGTDGQPTKITQVTVKPGTNNTANWANTIQGVKLSLDGGSSFVTIGTPTITAGSIVIPVTSGNLNIADSDAETVSLYVYLKTSGLTDNSVLEFKVDGAAHGFTADATGSTFLGTFASAPVSNDMLIDVDASKLLFVQQPSNTLANATMSPAVTIEATDANNNRDLDASGSVSLSSSGTMTGPVTATLASGFGTFGNIVHTVAGNSITLTASFSGLSDAVSNSFNVFSALAAGDILFIGYGTDDPDKFAFLVMNAIPDGTQISFTDNGWTGTALATNENTGTYTVPAGGLAKGAIVQIQGTTVTGGGTMSSGLTGLSTSGDQILAYQGSSASPSFISGVSTTGWISTGTPTSNQSYLPSPLAIYSSAVSFASEEDNGYYSGPSTLANGAAASLICNSANWTRSATIQTFPAWAFTLGNHTAIDVTATAQDLTVKSNETLTIDATRTLTVAGNLLIKSDASGTGSLIENGTLTSANTAVERYVAGGWSAWNTGWHQISSPVAGQAISAFETTGAGNDYDFYGWDEPTNVWYNYKDPGFSTWNSGSSFNAGQGYLISYEQTQTGKTFTGTLNKTDVTKTNLSNTGGFYYTGWHLLGNPFPSALTWNDGNWSLSNVAGTAKIWHEANKSYSDIAANGIIPSAQGFMVQVNSSSNGLTIPASARTHNSAPWYKSSDLERIFLVASESEGHSAQESQILINPSATTDFDFDYDSRFLAGYAPQFYSMAGAEMLSTNVLPSLPSGVSIPFGFVKNAAGSFKIELKENLNGTIVYLTDKKTNVVTNLTQSPVYLFDASEGDDAGRFMLSFGSLGSDDIHSSSGVRIFTSNGNIYVSLQQNSNTIVKVYSLTGQLVLQGNTGGKSLAAINAASLNKGVYIVSLMSGDQMISRKIVIK